jgi:antitoxin (DNA-binding transcriptional repressor) of toxin-antitoxin stability system
MFVYIFILGLAIGLLVMYFRQQQELAAVRQRQTQMQNMICGCKHDISESDDIIQEIAERTLLLEWIIHETPDALFGPIDTSIQRVLDGHEVEITDRHIQILQLAAAGGVSDRKVHLRVRRLQELHTCGKIKISSRHRAEIQSFHT